MKKIHLAVCTALISLGSIQAYARDTVATYSIEEALARPEAKAKLDPDIRLFFGNQPTPKVEKTLSEGKTNKKTNGFNKSDQDACQWAFLSAVLELQARARKDRGDAVVNILSNYKDMERSSETEFSCGSGALMSGVALKGKVVKLAR